eukprot:26261-Eustigmatos_ZCMA.PRE.1
MGDALHPSPSQLIRISLCVVSMQHTWEVDLERWYAVPQPQRWSDVHIDETWGPHGVPCVI